MIPRYKLRRAARLDTKHEPTLCSSIRMRVTSKVQALFAQQPRRPPMRHPIAWSAVMRPGSWHDKDHASASSSPWYFCRRVMSILRIVRTPAPRRFLPSLTIHNMFAMMVSGRWELNFLLSRLSSCGCLRVRCLIEQAHHPYCSFYSNQAHKTTHYFSISSLCHSH